VSSSLEGREAIPTYPYNYRGEVMNDVDPMGLGRVQVKVHPMFSTLETTDLPWAVPAPSLFSGAGNGYGEYITPEIGSWVFVFFEAGDFQQPVYFASAPTAQVGLPSTKGPRKKVIETKGGVVISVDDVTSEIKVSQPSGSFFEITASGKFLIGNPTVDLIGTLSDFLNLFSITGELVADPQGFPGGLEFKPTAVASIALLKAKIDLLKG
jgi:hypothetical protein